MNRDIKFREWRGDFMYQIDLENKALISGENYPLMQYTGLKDKNGVEIYEGDIMCDYDNEIIGTVEFVKGAFYVHSLHEKEFYDLWDFSSEEVIGNIYENPELLEDQL